MVKQLTENDWLSFTAHMMCLVAADAYATCQSILTPLDFFFILLGVTQGPRPFGEPMAGSLGKKASPSILTPLDTSEMTAFEHRMRT
jgi:hypothetical protein